MCSKFLWVSLVVSLIFISTSAWDNVPYKVKCFKDSMKIAVVQRNQEAKIYLEHLKNFPDDACKPVVNNSVATFRLSTAEDDLAKCGISRVVNLKTRETIYYHTVVVEDPVKLVKSKIIVQCNIMDAFLPLEESRLNHTLSRRSVLPAGFQEDETITLQGEIVGSAPIPMLTVGVRQGGNLVTGELNVSPGTPLQMEIYLDRLSASVYGLLVTYMQVTDMKSAEETIIFNGCSVDPYLFENFNTVDGDFLAAKFRAFKFPESTYVQFRGTVSVCLDKCQGVECSNGQIGYGRKKRSVDMSRDRNNIFEVTMSTYIKVDYDSNTILDKALLQFIRRGNNRTIERPVIDEEVREQFIYKLTETETNGSSYNYSKVWFISLILFLSLFQVF